MTRQFLCLLALVLGLVALLAGCALPWAQRATAKTPVALPDAQQVFRPLMVGVKNGDLESLDPAFIQFNSNYSVAQLIFPPLVTLDDHNQVAPWAADRWETSADGLTWTFHIHPGMTWSDGVPIDANTFAYSINRSLDPCIGSEVAYYLSGTGVELIKGSVDFHERTCPSGTTTSTDTLVGKSIIVADALTPKLILAQPAAYLLSSLTYSPAWAQPKQLIERYGPAIGRANLGWTDHLEGFGGNLFTVKRWDHAGHLDLVRNESSWGQRPKLREIDVTLYHDVDTMWADYKAGKGDYVSTPPPAELATLRAMPGFHEDPDPTVLYITPNWAIPPFDDVRVRQAFDLALDRRANGRLPSYAGITPTIHMVPQGVPGYNPTLADPAGRVGEAALSPDVAKAGALWKAYVDERFGGNASKAPAVVFCYRFGSVTAPQNAMVYLHQWQAALTGLQITAQGCGYGQQVNKVSTLPITTVGWIMDYPDPQDILSLLMHTGASYNQTSISVPIADVLLDQADGNPNPAERLVQYQQAEQLLVDAVAWIPTGQLLNLYLVRPTVAGGYHERAAGSAALAVWQRVYVTT